MSDREDMVALADVLRSRGRNNSLHDIERAAALLERFSARTGPDVAVLEALDLLQLQQRGRAKALRLLNAQREIPDMAELAQADAYERCGDELKAAIAALPAPATASAGEEVTEDDLADFIDGLGILMVTPIADDDECEEVARALRSTYKITKRSAT